VFARVVFVLISSPFVSYLWVALGAAIGAMLRFAAYRAVSATSFPLATLLVNTVGSFLIGLLAMLLLSDTKVDQSVRLFLQTGLLGALTTFSAFSLETVQLFQAGSYKAAVATPFAGLFGAVERGIFWRVASVDYCYTARDFDM